MEGGGKSTNFILWKNDSGSFSIKRLFFAYNYSVSKVNHMSIRVEIVNRPTVMFPAFFFHI